jgi:hypothetical protein
MKRERTPLPDATRNDLVGGIFPRDPVIEAYKKDVDRTILRENLKLTVEQRMAKFESFMKLVCELRSAGAKKS